MTSQTCTWSTLCSRRTSRVSARVGIGALLVLMIGICMPAAAQSGSGVAAIEGTVTDPDNQPIASALVAILGTDTGYKRFVFTDAKLTRYQLNTLFRSVPSLLILNSHLNYAVDVALYFVLQRFELLLKFNYVFTLRLA